MARGHVDVAVVGQDPRFGGGFRTQAETLWRALEELDREPHLYYLSRARAVSILRPGVAVRPVAERQGLLAGTAYPSVLPELDGVNQLVGGRRMGTDLRRARAVWVCAATAPYGYGAVAAGRPYACWIGTNLRDEWHVRSPLLPTSRRLALRLNAPLLRRLERQVLRGATAVYATSPYSRASVARAADLPLDQVRAIPVPIDFARFPAEPDDEWVARLDREEPVIVFVGRASDPRKNLPLLLDAFERVRSRYPRARLRLVGAPPGKGMRIGGNVDVLGELPDIVDSLRSSTLFALPSLQEGFGIVVAEALACGVPAVVTPSGGPEHLVGESGGGRVLQSFDPEEMATAMLELLEDRDALLEMRRGGREHVIRAHAPGLTRDLVAAALAELEAA